MASRQRPGVVAVVPLAGGLWGGEPSSAVYIGEVLDRGRSGAGLVGGRVDGRVCVECAGVFSGDLKAWTIGPS